MTLREHLKAIDTLNYLKKERKKALDLVKTLLTVFDNVDELIKKDIGLIIQVMTPFGACPNCRTRFERWYSNEFDNKNEVRYCPKCGQKVYWDFVMQSNRDILIAQHETDWNDHKHSLELLK